MTSLGATRTGEGPLLVALHGFTQTSSSMAPLTSILAENRTVAALDLPGHGTSATVSADLDEAAALVVDAAGGESFDLVGYSLGGRVALHVACLAPPGLRSTIAISSSLGIVDGAARTDRLARDMAMADALDRDGDVEGFIARWLANPLFATLPGTRADVRGRLANTAHGLADSLRRCSVGSQRLLEPELATLAAPLLLLAGMRDDPCLAAAVAASRHPAVAAAAVPGSGHVCHLEQPRLTARLIECFLASR
jgi:2-succinyl-6-hydroxy-2,4-cyclohexadiene-1-carboxylate synthase